MIWCLKEKVIYQNLNINYWCIKRIIQSTLSRYIQGGEYWIIYQKRGGNGFDKTKLCSVNTFAHIFSKRGQDRKILKQKIIINPQNNTLTKQEKNKNLILKNNFTWGWVNLILNHSATTLTPTCRTMPPRFFFRMLPIKSKALSFPIL